MTAPCRRLTRAFTLIELLVVIAVISLLAAILFPVFSGVREKARQATCASNLRNLTLGLLMYTQDSDERVPLSAYATPTGFAAWFDLIDPYIKNKDVWHCPSSAISPTDADGKVTSHFGYNAYYLTGVNRFFSNVGAQKPLSLADIDHPAGTVLFTDTRASVAGSLCGDHGNYLLPPSLPDTGCWGRPAFLHQQQANVAWLDGHVRASRSGGFYSAQIPVDRFFDPKPQ